MNELGIVVLSCDKYSDLWPPCFELLHRAWPDCPFKVHLAANRRTFDDPRVTTVLSGDDTDWSSSIRRSLQQVDHDAVLLLYDDAFLMDRVPTTRVLEHVAWFTKNNANYLRMRPTPRPDARISAEVGLIRPGTPYRTSLFASIWRRNVLVDILKDGESAWAFELQGLRRAEAMDGFYSTYRQVFSYLHGVEKGKWFPWAVRALRKAGVQPNLEERSVMSVSETIRYLSRLPRGYLLQLLPPSTWPKVLEAKRSVRGLFRN